MSQRLVALTGATGFLGVHLVRALAAADFRVRVLARRPPSEPGWGGVAPERIKGSLEDEKAVDQLVDGADVVVHAAGVIKADTLAGYMGVNCDGVLRMAAAVERRAPSARFLLVSSLAAREPKLSRYAASKAAGEAAAAALINESRLVVVRPPAIYGPGDLETFTVFKAAAKVRCCRCRPPTAGWRSSMWRTPQTRSPQSPPASSAGCSPSPTPGRRATLGAKCWKRRCAQPGAARR